VARVEQLIGSHQPKSYVRATTLLVDLRDVGERAGRGDGFALQLAALRARHAAKPAFQSRLQAAGWDSTLANVLRYKDLLISHPRRAQRLAATVVDWRSPASAGVDTCRGDIVDTDLSCDISRL